jgi:Uma2 family endonuclease
MSLHEKQYSYADYLTFPEGERWEIIDEVPYLQAVPSRIHQEILMELSRQISNYLIGKSCKVYPAPFCVRLNNEKGDDNIISVVKPDITVVCDNSKLDKSGCKGSPDMIIEILSPSTAKNDKIIKFNKYEKVGVKEY